MLSFVHKVQAEVSDLGDRVNHVETKMGEYAEVHNEVVDAHGDTEDLVHQLQQKIGSRRNAMVLESTSSYRGAPESVNQDPTKRTKKPF